MRILLSTCYSALVAWSVKMLAVQIGQTLASMPLLDAHNAGRQLGVILDRPPASGTVVLSAQEWTSASCNPHSHPNREGRHRVARTQPAAASASTASAIFSPTMMLGMLVLARGTIGMIEASATRRPPTP